MGKLKDKAATLEMELADLYAMSEEAARFRYNVDYKNEAIAMINEDLIEVYNDLELFGDDDDADERYADWADPAFRSVADFDRMRI